MAGLPENWEWDYDGKRWFYRYKPTGLIQFTFPKPGDEFPEFVDDNSAPPDLAPEEKLVSQQQIKRRGTLVDSSSENATTADRRQRAPSNAVSDPDDGGGPFWLQPDGLMYMGPGAYNDISPLQEEEEERGLGSSKADEKDTVDGAVASPRADTDTAASTSVAAEATPNQVAAQPTRSQISPIASVETTPLVISGHPATATPELDGAVIIQTNEHVPVDTATMPSPEIQLLDSKPIPYNPIGFVAELASELTARCDDEINPAPVELPGNESMLDTPEPAYSNGFHLAPAELASDEVPARRTTTGNVDEEKVLASQHPRRAQVQEQQQRAYQAVQELLNRPYRPARQPSTESQPAPTLAQAPNHPTGSETGKYQPYNPTRHPALAAAATNRYSTAISQVRQPADVNKRHSLAGPVLSQYQPSDVPPALLPPHVPPKLPLDISSNTGQTTIPDSRARPNTISDPTTKRNSGGLAYFPSILQPARGRPPIRAQSPPQSQGASPARTYQAYKPYRDLQRDIEDTVQLLSKTGYGQGTPETPETSNPGRPQISRTSTLPAHLPALPYMGVRPQLPHSMTSEPVTLKSLQPHQAPLGEPSRSIPSGGEAGMPILQEYSAPLPPSSMDVPQPLNLSRKSPPPQSSIPTAPSSFRPPTTAKSGETSPGSSIAIAAATPVMANSAPQTSLPHRDLGAAGETGDHAGQAGAAIQPNAPAALTAPGQPHSTSFVVDGTEDTNRVVTSNGQPQPAVHTLPEQVASSGFSVLGASSSSPAPQSAASTRPAAVKPETSSQPALATSFAVEAANAPPPVLTDAQYPPILSDGALVSQSGTPSRPLITEVQTVAADQIRTVQTRLPGVSPTPPSTSRHQASLSNPANGLGVQQAANPPPPLVTPRPPSPRTPSPVSRASSPETQRANIPQNISSVTLPVVATTIFPQSSAPTGQASLNQDGMRAPAIQHGALPMAFSSPPPNFVPAASSTAPAHALPRGHHPLASHPEAIPQPSPPGPPNTIKPSSLHADGSGIQQQQSGNPAQTVPGTHPQVPPAGQSSVGNSQPAGTSSPQQPPQPTAQNPNPNQGPPMPVPSAFVAQQGAAIPTSSSQAPQNMPPRTFSHPVFSQSGPPHHPGAPGTAPTQMQMMFAPPAMPPGMPQQGVQPGMLPQQHYAFQPGMFPQAGMQHPQMPPHMMQPSQMPGGPYVMQQPRPAPPVKEEKSWFGKLWRSDSVKPNQSSATSPTNRLQKGTRPQAPMVFPPQLHPNQPVPALQFATATQMPQHMMMMHQQQPPHGMQPQPQQQHQQHQGAQQPQQLQFQQPQPLAWKVNTGNGNGNGNQMPQFQAPNRNPNQPVMPPPQVRQTIQQQEQQLKQAQRQSLGPGPAAQGGQAQMPAGQNGGAPGKGEANTAPAPATAGEWGKANGTGYDGSGWGDDDDQ